jgi:flagellar basal-body rod protein FlgC
VSDAFSILKVATSGMGVFKTWLNAVADNIANINNVAKTEDPAFQERFISVASRVGADGVGDGAVVTGVQFGDAEGRVVYDANHPYADENGMVRMPDIDLSEQMVYMQLAQRGYQANVRSFESAREAYETILSIGR